LFYGGNYAEKTTVPEQTAAVETGMPESVEQATSSGSGSFSESAPSSGAETTQEQKTEKETKPAGFAGTKTEDKSAESDAGQMAIDPETGKDRFLTDSVPPGKPRPVEWQDVTVNPEVELACTLSVSCKTILDNIDRFNKDKLEVLPADGLIYPARTVVFYEGESVFNVLQREMKKHKIHMEFEMTPLYNSNYIEGINNIYEFDCGELSGWMYKVNGWFPNYGCSRYQLKDGDVIELVYTCDLGRDLGEEWLGQSGR
jgi:hypothetical protein